MLCRYVMDFHFSVMEKSWKVIVEKEWAPCRCLMIMTVMILVSVSSDNDSDDDDADVC